MQKDSISSHSLGTFLSPVGSSQKGWSSERVPLKGERSNRRHIGTTAFTPCYSGRTSLPSKWEDAERWICSPVGDNGRISSLYQPQRRPKSKSGPLGPLGTSFYLNLSPAMPVFDGGMRNYAVGSPFSTGVLGADNLGFHFGAAGRGNFPATASNMGRSVSIPSGWSDLGSEPSRHGSQDEKLDGSNDEETTVSRAISRRDMATQISPDKSVHSSPNERPSLSSSPPSLVSVVDQNNDSSAEFEVRDVPVDRGATLVKQFGRHGRRKTKINSLGSEEYKKNDTDDQASSWSIVAAENNSKLQREEAKIIAWENLQKAKAEAAMRELEMKLEKKRSSSMDKILNKLRAAEKKAGEMRSLLSANQGQRAPTLPRQRSYFSKHFRMNFFRGCFTDHA